MMEKTGYLAAMFAPSHAESEYKAIVIKVEHTATDGNLLSVVPDNADQCLGVLLVGRQIIVRLMSPEGEFAAFPLENDASFAHAYSKLKRLILSD
jgi:hypothetical protein